MQTKNVAPSRKRPAGPSLEAAEEPSTAPESPEPRAEPRGVSIKTAGEADPPAPSAPPKRRWQAPRADDWERREGFRATLLLHLPTPRERATYRRMGQILYDASLARSEEAAESSEAFAFRQVEALLSELRFLQGFAEDVAELHDLDEEQAIARLGHCARKVGKRLSRLADGLAQELDADAKPD